MTPGAWLDRITEPIAPRWTLKRQRARMASELMARAYDSASAGRRTQGWRRNSGDVNAAIGQGLHRTRDVARDMVRNNSHAASALRTIVNHGVGWGIVAQTPKGSWWKEWAETAACDSEGRLDFAGIQKQVLRTVAEAGECLIRRRARRMADIQAGLPIPLQLQVLEPDYLDTQKEGRSATGGRIIQGVEYDVLGRRSAYWLFPEHPGASNTVVGIGFGASRRIPATEILHVFLPERPGQVRGMSWFAPVVLRMKDFDDYEDAALMKQKIAACLAVITTDVDGTSPALGTVDAAQPMVDQLEPGAILNVTQGRSVAVVQPPTINEHDAYSRTILRAIASGLGLSYEDLTGDYCIAPETRVLRADLRWVRADELQEGDELVAFDEERPAKGAFRKHRHATVVRAGRRDLPRIAVKTDRAALTVSSCHKFLCVRPNKGTSSNWRMHHWVEAQDLEPGDKILFLVEPWEQGTTHAHGYLKGIADGEGWIDAGTGRVGIAQNRGPVFDEIGAALKELGFTAKARHANSGGTVWQWDMCRMDQTLRFLGEVRPTRLLAKARIAYDGKSVGGGVGRRPIYATVLSASDDGVGPVVTLETSTHTVITEGLYSHNTATNFSSARMSRMRAWSNVEDWRWRMLILQLCLPVWQWAQDAAAIIDKPALPAVPEWTAPAMPSVDPETESNAYKRMVRIGAMSWGEMVRERGYDPDTVLQEIKAWNGKLDQAGVVLDSDPRKTTEAGNPRDSASTAAPSGASPAKLPAPSTNGNGARHHIEDQPASAARVRMLEAELADLRTRLDAMRPIEVNVTAPPAPNVTVAPPAVTIADGAIRAGDVHVAAPPPAEVLVDARTTLEAGAVQVPVSVLPPPPAEVTVDARTTIAEGAVHLEAPVTVQQAPAPPNVTVVRAPARPQPEPGSGVAATDAE